MTREYKKKPLLFVIPVVVILLLSVVVPGYVQAEEGVDGEENETDGYTVRDPIRINGNSDFAAQAAAEDWPGDGSEGNPYVIEGYEINGTGYGYGIYVGNTTVHFVVRNCYIHNVTGKDGTAEQNSGFYLYKVQNGRFEDNRLYNKWGFALWLSKNNVITNNTIYVIRGGWGVDIIYSDNITISANYIYYRDIALGWAGIGIFESEHNKIVENYISDFKTGIEFENCYEYEVNNNIFNNVEKDIVDEKSISNHTLSTNSSNQIIITALIIAMIVIFVVIIYKKKVSTKGE